MNRDIAQRAADYTANLWDKKMQQEAEAEAEWERTHQHLLAPRKSPRPIVLQGWDVGSA